MNGQSEMASIRGAGMYWKEDELGVKGDTGLGSAAAVAPLESSGVVVRVVGVEGKIEFIHDNGVEGRGWGDDELKYPI